MAPRLVQLPSDIITCWRIETLQLEEYETERFRFPQDEATTHTVNRVLFYNGKPRNGHLSHPTLVPVALLVGLPQKRGLWTSTSKPVRIEECHRR